MEDDAFQSGEHGARVHSEVLLQVLPEPVGLLGEEPVLRSVQAHALQPVVPLHGKLRRRRKLDVVAELLEVRAVREGPEELSSL